jgi:sugar/nucleoside kinase (ribokinase family)
MADTRFDVLGIGNAIVDIIARAEEDFLVREKLVKGSMRLIDAAEAERLYGAMAPAIETSGGSAGNTVAGVASLGGRAAFFGKVANDQLGQIYRHDMHAQGVHFQTAPEIGGPPTARSMIVVTPDGERTMNTYLGACLDLSPEDVDAGVVRDSAILYMEGYLYDPPKAKEAFRAAAGIAHKAGRKVSLTLSDSFCVDRYRAEFLGMIRDHTIDILLANDSEAKSLYETSSLDAAIRQLGKDCKLAAVTVGSEGCYVVDGASIDKVPAHPVEEVVDLTGAGDLFAAGFLYGVARGMTLTDAAGLGSLAAASVIGHVGPRPAVSLQDLARRLGHRV